MPVLLIGRSLIGFWFAMRFAGLLNPSWDAVFNLLADYLMVDGIAGLVVAAFVLRAAFGGRATREWTLGVMMLADGVGRLGSGVLVHQLPGIPGFPVSAIVFLGVMAACTAAVGFTEVMLVVDEERARHGPHHRRPQFAAIPVGIAALASVAFGVAAINALDDSGRLQALLTYFIVAASCTMVAMAGSRHFAKRNRIVANR